MSVDIRSCDRRRHGHELHAREKEIAAGLLKTSQPASPKVVQENEKRIRREIANSNERRRMQCINAGFSNLKALIPQLEGEKLSKAAILQHATEYISSMEKDKMKLQMQLEHTKRMLSQLGQDRVLAEAYESSSPPPSKRKKRDTESSDEGVGSLSDGSDDGSDLQQENVTLRHQLELEKQHRTALQERVCFLETELLAQQTKSSQYNTSSDLHSVKHEEQHSHRRPNPEALYIRKVDLPVEQVLVAPPVDENIHPRPASPISERINLEASYPLDATIQRSVTESLRYCVVDGDRLPSTVKMDTITARDIVSARNAETPAHSDDFPVVAVTTAAPTVVSSLTDQVTRHSHCPRDHPRRRHRQQAQLEQERAEEELRRQKEQQQLVAAVPSLYRPNHSTQNLEKLVEAIRQIEGFRILDEQRTADDKYRLYDEKHRLYDQCSLGLKHDNGERLSTSANDQRDVQSQSSGQDFFPHHHHQQQQVHQQTVEASHSHTTLPVTLGPNTSSSSSSFSEKYPIASRLLHRPLEPSYYRPGVIVHKQ